MRLFLQQGGWVLGIALLLAVGDWIAVARSSKRMHCVFKPATMVAVLVAAWLLTRGPHVDRRMTFFFFIALGFSLLGDVFLLLSGKRFFLAGVLAFLVAHIFYIIGLNPTLPPLAALSLLFSVAVVSSLLFRRLASALQESERMEMVVPLSFYVVILSLMLVSAWASLFRFDWLFAKRCVLILAATLFFSSDSMLAWNRFVRASFRLRLLVIITYHLAQMAFVIALTLG